MKEALSSLWRRLRNAWRFRLTESGKHLYVALMFGCAWGAATLRMPIYHLAAGLLVLAMLPWVAKLVLRPRLQIAGRFPPTATAGQVVSSSFRLDSQSPRPVYDLGLGFFALPPSVQPVADVTAADAIDAGDTCDLPVKLRPLRRGLYPLPELHAFTTFPLGLWKSEVARHPAQPLLVLPDFHSLAALDVPLGRRYQPGGVTLTSNIGESPEYIGNREYQYGDPVRRIDFRSWARLTKPAVREYQEEYYCRIALVLDTFVEASRKPGPEGYPELEAAVSLSAACADVLARGEYLIDLFAAGPDLYVFRAGRSLAHFDNLLEILACVEECRESPFETIAPALAEELANITAVLFVLLDWDKPRQRFVRMAAEAGASVKAIVVRDGEPTESPHEAEEWMGPVSLLAPEHIREGRVEAL